MYYVLLFILAMISMVLFILIKSANERKKVVVNHYQIKSNKITKNKKLTFVMFADLHSKTYGKDNQYLVDLVKKEMPQGILIPGDLIIGKTNEDFTTALNLLEQLAQIAPVYYSNGNHEQRMKYYNYTGESGVYETDEAIQKTDVRLHYEFLYHKNKAVSKYDHYLEQIKKLGIHHLDNENCLVDIMGEKIRIWGLEIPFTYFKKFNHNIATKEEVESLLDAKNVNQNYNILLAHNPVHMKAYVQWGADLTVSGHLHGGIIRIPGIGGLITPQVKVLPKYFAGLYHIANKAAVVTRGLGEHTVKIRVFNPPELSVIHITGE